MTSNTSEKSPVTIYFLVLISGMAALSWEVIWQIKSTLALGVSAWGTALTLATTMGGMCVGALVMGHILRNKTVTRPVRIYGALECIIGISGLFLPAAFRLVETLDGWAYTALPGSATMVHLLSIAVVLGIPAMCMGATLPVLGLTARQFRTSIALLYGFNTFGAAVGVLITAFLLIPSFGLIHATWVIAAANIAVGILAWTLGQGETGAEEHRKQQITAHLQPQLNATTTPLIVFITGFATFMLEIAWFRSLTAAFISTTDAFAIMLSSVLVALGVAAWFAPLLKRSKISLGTLVSWSGVLILLATPVIERFDLFIHVMGQVPAAIFIQWFLMTLYVIGAPVLLLGVALPWILDDQDTPRKWGSLYALNAFASILGAICAAWIFLPTIGFARTAWMTGSIVICAGILAIPPKKRIVLSAFGITALLVAIIFESGVGRTRVQGAFHFSTENKPSKILESYEGPDVTASAVEYEDGGRILFIDGFVATQQPEAGEMLEHVHYMAWMGHMPMLLHPDPRNALVICFGTGQTANAVRNEDPESLDIVDINKNVFKLAHNFPSNENVLEDSKVKTIIMDGRAYLRRMEKIYDVITLEPMPPNFAGVNALYSREFYQLARNRLGDNGIIAQWLPFHLVSPYYGASIAKTFQSVFPNAILWIDPPSNVGILLGSVNDNAPLGTSWPGFERPGIMRDLSEREIQKAVMLDQDALQRYSAYGQLITDNNQLLAYGKAAYALRRPEAYDEQNHALLKKIKDETP